METDEQFEADLKFLLLKSSNEEPNVKLVNASENVHPKVNKHEKKARRTKYKLTMKEITKDMDEISFSSDSHDEPLNPQQLSKGEKTSEHEKTDEPTEELAKKLKKKRPRQKKKKKPTDTTTHTETQDSETKVEGGIPDDSKPSGPAKAAPTTSKIIPKAPQKSFLTAMEPTKSIIGLSNSQILSLPVNDVKLKLLISSGSKHIQNIVKFAKKESEDLFEDYERKRVFFQLCIDVALTESIGFKKVVKKWPQIIDWFGSYPEINLATTKTRLTPSNREIHQNNFDYSMLSLIGHILIWGSFLQRRAKQVVFTKKYDISMSEVRECLGGDFLWDRLSQHPKMNAKRWKHVIKYRQNFPFEVNQFMMVLRFMKVDDFSSCSDED